MVEKIACFMTCGYTEAGAMQSFLGKMNAGYKFKQYLPNKTRKRKGDFKIIKSDQSGLTGEGLLKKIYEICRNHREEILDCKAVLVEDDLDGRFSELSEKEIEESEQNIVKEIRKSLGSDNMPVFLLYASPEIESWFIADWEHGFQQLYCDKDVVCDIKQNGREFFTFHLRQYIEKEILQKYADDLEEYGWFDGRYIKLSEQIIAAVQTDAKRYIQSLPNVNEDIVNQIIRSGDLCYSKNKHGDRMLRTIQPDIVEKKCRRYYRKAYYEISSFNGADE